MTQSTGASISMWEQGYSFGNVITAGRRYHIIFMPNGDVWHKEIKN